MESTGGHKSDGAYRMSQRSRVLLVEDERAARQALAALLRHYGYDVLSAATVEEGLRQAESNPEFILLDLMLPDGGGERVLEYVRERRLGSQVTVITGSNDPDRLAALARFAPKAVLRKPVDFSEILKQVKQAG